MTSRQSRRGYCRTSPMVTCTEQVVSRRKNKHIIVCTSMYQYVPVCTRMNRVCPSLSMYFNCNECIPCCLLSSAQAQADSAAASSQLVQGVITSMFLLLHAFHKFAYCLLHILCVRPAIEKFQVFWTGKGIPFLPTCIVSSRWLHCSVVVLATVQTTKPCVKQSD